MNSDGKCSTYEISLIRYQIKVCILYSFMGIPEQQKSLLTQINQLIANKRKHSSTY